MTLYDCKIGEECRVLEFLGDDEVLFHRLMSIGIVQGAKIKILNHTLIKSTLSVLINHTQIALRDIEAKLISVEK